MSTGRRGELKNEGGPFGDLVAVAKKRDRNQMTPDPDPPQDVAPGAPSVPVLHIHTPEQMQLIEECTRLGISPPKDSQGAIAEWGHVVKRIKSDGFGKHLGAQTTGQAKILMFLYGRRFFADDDTRRKQEVALMLDSASSPFQRALQVIRADGDITKASCVTRMEEWKVLVSSAYVSDEEEGPCVSVFTSFPVQIVQRVQHAASCFMHAPVVVQAYKLQGSGAEGVPAVDICKYVRYSFGCNALSNFLVHDSGGDSIAVLNNILDKPVLTNFSARRGLDFVLSSESGSSDACMLQGLLAKNGAALVSQFRLTKRFQEYEQPNKDKIELPFFTPNEDELKVPLFGGKNPNDKVATHAMVLVGLRRINNEWRLLLQNWWPHMQFVEVSSDYFSRSGAKLGFVVAEQHEIPKQFERCDSLYAEAGMNGCDVPEKVYDR